MRPGAAKAAAAWDSPSRDRWLSPTVARSAWRGRHPAPHCAGRASCLNCRAPETTNEGPPRAFSKPDFVPPTPPHCDGERRQDCAPSPARRGRGPGGGSSSMNILVVDDDRDIADIIGYSLRKEGHRAFLAYSGEEALALAEQSRPDLVVLDVMLPGLSGFDVCRKLRERGPVPVILLTARGEEADRVWGLDLGADDYGTKPFSHRELLARIRAVARRSAAAETPDQGSVSVGELEIDFGAH